MPGVTTDRAIVFMSEPQHVEVYRGGDWVLGSMLGWRHEDDSSCWAMVRLTEGRTEKTAWADLENVRLPEERDCSPAEPRTVLLTLAGRPVTGPSSSLALPGDGEVSGPAGRHRAPAGIAPDGTTDRPDVAPTAGPVSAELTRPLTLPSPPRRRRTDVRDGTPTGW